MPLAEARELSEAGPGGRVAMSRVLAVGKWESAPIRRAARKARTEGRLIDLTYGYACKWALFLDSGHVVLATAMLDGEAELQEEGSRKEEEARSKGQVEGGKLQVTKRQRAQPKNQGTRIKGQRARLKK